MEGEFNMSEKEKAIQLLDKVPEYKIECIVAYIEGVIAGNSYEPNDTTIAAFQEGDTMLTMGTGKRYKDMDELFADLED
jgi:hypothetical protein